MTAVTAPTSDEVLDELIGLAAELAGTVRDYGPDAVAGVLARVPAGRHDALAVVLAAMVDPDRTPTQLLGWLEQPVQSREGVDPGRPTAVCPTCGRTLRATSLQRHVARRHRLREAA